MSYDTNPYYNPENLGLQLEAEYDLYGEAYEFSLVIVLRDQDGTLWGAFDSGCSCPTPFEDHTFPTDFTMIRTADDVDGIIRSNAYGDYVDRAGRQEFLRRVRELLGERG